MNRYWLSRIAQTVPTVVGGVTLVFLLLHVIPGDPVDLMLGDSAAKADTEALRAQLGLDLSLGRQYVRFWARLFDGTWGQSFSHARPVLTLILERFPLTLSLTCASLLVALAVSFPLGMVAARRRGAWVDTAAMSVAVLSASVPMMILGPLAILVFSILLRWLPVSGAGTVWHLLLPAGCLGVGVSGLLARMLRSSVIDSLSEDFVRTARAKGLSERRVLWTHALRNALLPVLTVLGNLVGSLLAGAVLTETIFDWPGLGRLFYSAFQARDYPLIQGIVLWIALVFVTINLLVDIAYAWVDPRVRLGGESR